MNAIATLTVTKYTTQVTVTTFLIHVSFTYDDPISGKEVRDKATIVTRRKNKGETKGERKSRIKMNMLAYLRNRRLKKKDAEDLAEMARVQPTEEAIVR